VAVLVGLGFARLGRLSVLDRQDNESEFRHPLNEVAFGHVGEAVAHDYAAAVDVSE
jgi:hypothetical protein